MKTKAIIFLACVLVLFTMAGCQSEETDLSSSSSEEQQSISESPSSQSSSSSVISSSSSSISSIASSASSSSSTSAPQSASSAAPNSSSAAPASTQSNPDPLGLMGEGEIALFVANSSTGGNLELNKTKANEFLSKINLSNLSRANMKQEITPPDAMIGQAGTDGNYISIGMPHTSTLFIYDTQTQALLVTASGKIYYDMPTDMFDTVKSALNG